MQITTAKLAGMAAAVALAAGAAGGVAGASLAGDSNPDVAATPQPTATALAPTLPAEVQDAPAAPAEIVQQIEANVTVNDVAITDARIYTVADTDVVVAMVNSVDSEVNAVGIWMMENNVIFGAANAPAAETTNFEQVEPPAEVSAVVAEAEASVPTAPAAGGDRVPAVVDELVARNMAAQLAHNKKGGESGSFPVMSGPFEAATVTGADGRTYTAVSWVRYFPDSGGPFCVCGVWVGDELAPLTEEAHWADPETPQPNFEADPDAVLAAARAVGFVPASGSELHLWANT